MVAQSPNSIPSADGTKLSSDLLRLVVIVTLMTSMIATLSVSAASTEGTECTSPSSVSRDISPFSTFPHLVGDANGQVHLVWSSGVTPDRNAEQVETDTVFYTTLVDGAWTQPVDILTDSTYAMADSIIVAPGDNLLVSWHTRSGLNVSRAPSAAARSARNWTTRDLSVGSVSSSNLMLDANGRVHLAYTVHEPARSEGRVGYVWSDDAGVTWSNPSEFGFVNSGDEINTSIQIYASGDGYINLAWQRNAAVNSWLPTGIWYAASSDGGKDWSQPELVFSGSRAAYPNLSASASPNGLYMTWLRGVGFEDSKYLRVSADGGRTWTEPRTQFLDLQGLNGPMPIVADSADGEHWIMSGDQGSKTRIWHATRSAGTSWTQPSVISGELQDSEFPQAVIVRGNELHIVWNDFVEDDIYSVVCHLSAPAASVPPNPKEHLDPKNTLTAPVIATATASPEPSPTIPEPRQVPMQDIANGNANAAVPNIPPLVSAVLPVGVLLGAVLVWRLSRRR
jgi:hypothetical protein